MSNPTTQERQLVRFEEVTPTHEIVAFFSGHLKSLVAHLQLPLFDGYDDLDEIQFVFLTLPSGQTVTLGQYAHSPQVGVDLYVDPKLQDIPAVTFEACKYLEVPREEVVWFHPDWQDEIDRLYADHGANEKRPESSQLERLTQLRQYEPIDCFNHALRIYTREYVPATYWAMLQHNLGLAYFNRNQGDRRENLERSIECFNKSLEIYTRNEFLEKWKINQDDLRESLRSLLSLKSLQKKCLAEDIIDRPMPERDLKKVDLSGADLISANLSYASLNDASLNGANLNEADLRGADLKGADLRFSKLSGSNLSGSNVQNTRFGYNRGISVSMKQDLIERGAIFDDTLGDQSESKISVSH
jgi:hypothetical protein